jgi:hypothetical protein
VPCTDTHSTVSSLVNAICGLEARLRAFFEPWAQLNMNRCSASCHTPHTGNECGWPVAEAVTTQ